MAVLPKRFGKYGLTLHPGKTRLVCFTEPDSKSIPDGELEDRGGSICSDSRISGGGVVVGAG